MAEVLVEQYREFGYRFVPLVRDENLAAVLAKHFVLAPRYSR